jgi:hypothetical protein
MNSIQHTIYRVGIVATVVVAVIACNLGLNPMSRNDGETSLPGVDDPTIVGPQTGVNVRVPTISSRLLSGLDAIYRTPSSGQLSAQALLFATSMNVRVFDWDDGLFPGGDWLEDSGLPEPLLDITVDATTSLGGEPSETGSPSYIESFLDIDAGTDYSIAVDVYNSNWDGIGPVVSGFSATEFDILPGQSTVVPIVALPNDPELPVLGTPDALSIVQTAYTYSTDPEEEGRMIMSGVGGEDWMSIDLSGETLTIDSYVRVVADPGGTTNAALLIYDEAGIYMFEDQPGMSWGLLPAEVGGEGGTRAALMGPAFDGETGFVGYMGVVLLDQTESPPPLTSENVTVTIEVINRPPADPPYTNSVDADTEPEASNFLPIGVGEGGAVTQTLFNNEMTEVHWYSLNDTIDTNGIDWEAPDLLNPLPITVTATFDVLDAEHIQGGRYEYDGEDDFFIPALALLIGEDSSPDPPEIYGPNDDPGFVVTENVDGSSTIEFTIDVDTTSVGSSTMAAVAVSSRWMGVEYTLSWNAPGVVELIVE